ncbi:MAG: hypothetical protein SPJ13_03060 [Bacteroidales bacterium]|nr:hypothetical protein [Bacteroidales bacterium]
MNKKVFLSLALVAMLGLGFTSCKKTCTCTVKGVTNENTDMNEDQCKAANTAAAVLGGKCVWE